MNSDARELAQMSDNITRCHSSYSIIRKRLWRSLQILEECITTAHKQIICDINGNVANLETMDKLAKRVCNFETQFVKC